jgi:putative heme-binding domain-containing protein
MGALRSEHIWLALMDSVAGIRENAIKLAELHLTEDPDLVKSLLPLQEDPDAKVRFQLLCTLGSVATPEAEQARHQLLFRDIDNEWVQVAALSVKSSQTSLLKLVLDNFKDESPAYASMVQRLTTMAGGVEEPRAIHTLIQMATDTNQHAWQGSVLDGLAEGMKNRAPRVFIAEADEQLLINTFFQHRAAAVRNASLRLLKVNGIKKEALAIAAIEKAVLLAGDPDESPDKRAEAISFISLRDPSAYDSLMKKLFVPQEPLTIQLAALRTLAASRDTTVSQFLLDQWSTLTPEIQDAVVSQFLNSKFRIAMLLNAIEAGTIGETSITWPRKVRLMAQSDEVLRDKARALFTKNNDAEVNKSYQQALALKGDEVKGKEIYQKNCALCHQVRGAMGVSLGPDLGTVHNWSKEAILANTLAPNKSISSGYDLWAVELSNGETLQGIIASETPGAITFKNTGSVEKTISRKDIKSLKAQNMSVMTVGLEKQITHQEMADLLAFLKQNK